MSNEAIDSAGEKVLASDVAPETWEEWKSARSMGFYRMTCCRAPAVLKTGFRGTQFFAHSSDECATAPETEWHTEGKALLLGALYRRGIEAETELRSPPGQERWVADTFFVLDGRKIAIELQRSPQTVKRFIERQERYVRAGVECYWLARTEVFKSVASKTALIRMQREWGGGFPPGQNHFAPLLKDFPISCLKLGVDPMVCHAGLTSDTLEAWLDAIIARRYCYHDGIWAIEPPNACGHSG